MSPALVLPISGWMKSPSQVSSAALVRYSWARWIGLRVWKATIFFQPRVLEVGFVLGRRLVAAHEGLLVVGQRVDLDRAGDAAVALLVDRGDARVGLVGGAVDLLGLALDVALPDLLDRDPAQRLAFVAGELDDVADLALEVGRQGDRDRPVVAVGGPHLAADALPVGGALEAGQRREAAVADHLEVGRVALGKGQGKLSHRLAHRIGLTNRVGEGNQESEVARRRAGRR